MNSRADDLSTLLDSIGQAISTLEVADEGITTLQEFVEQAKSIANSARDTANVASKVVSEDVTFNTTTAKTDLVTDLVANAAAGDSFTIRLGDATTVTGTANVAADQTLEAIGLAEDSSVEMIVGDKMYKFSFTDADTGISSSSYDETTGVTSQSFGIDTTLEEFMSDLGYSKFAARKSVEEALGNNEEASADPFYNFVSDSILPYAKAEPAYIWEISRKYADALETVTQLGKEVDATLATLEKDLNNLIEAEVMQGTNPFNK